MIFGRFPGWTMRDVRGPFAELDRMRRQVNRLADQFRSASPGVPSAGVFPLINVSENKDGYTVRAELPGIKAEDLNISVTGNGVSISGERKGDPELEEARYHRREREHGNFSRMVSLPTQIDTGKVEAESKDGILTIVLPKAESAKPKQISVTSA